MKSPPKWILGPASKKGVLIFRAPRFWCLKIENALRFSGLGPPLVGCGVPILLGTQLLGTRLGTHKLCVQQAPQPTLGAP